MQTPLLEDHHVHTHRDAHAKQSANDIVNDTIQILIARLRAVDLPVGIISQTQTEEIRLRNDEIQILIEDLSNMFRRPGCSYLAREILQ